MFMLTQVTRLMSCVIATIVLVDCTSAPPPHDTAVVAALKVREAVCAHFIEMDASAEAEAVYRLRGADQYRCDQLQGEAIRLIGDPAANPSGDPKTTRFLEDLAYPQGRD
jgi:hypothetical protein